MVRIIAFLILGLWDVSRLQCREEDPGRTQWPPGTEETMLSQEKKVSRGCWMEYWTGEVCTGKGLWRAAEGTHWGLSRVPISVCIQENKLVEAQKGLSKRIWSNSAPVLPKTSQKQDLKWSNFLRVTASYTTKKAKNMCSNRKISTQQVKLTMLCNW